MYYNALCKIELQPLDHKTKSFSFIPCAYSKNTASSSHLLSVETKRHEMNDDVLECLGGASQLPGDTCLKHMLLVGGCEGLVVVEPSLPAAAQRIRYITLVHTCLGSVGDHCT